MIAKILGVIPSFLLLSATPCFANSVWLKCSHNTISIDYSASKGYVSVGGKEYSGSAEIIPTFIYLEVPVATEELLGSFASLRWGYGIDRKSLQYIKQSFYRSYSSRRDSGWVEDKKYQENGKCVKIANPTINNKI